MTTFQRHKAKQEDLIIRKDVLDEKSRRDSPSIPISKIVFPDVLTPFIDYLYRYGHKLSLVRLGFDGVELYTDPYGWSEYLELSYYLEESRYQARKMQYEQHTSKYTIEEKEVNYEFAKEYQFRGQRRALLYADDESKLLIWKENCVSPKNENLYVNAETFLSQVLTPFEHITAHTLNTI